MQMMKKAVCIVIILTAIIAMCIMTAGCGKKAENDEKTEPYVGIYDMYLEGNVSLNSTVELRTDGTSINRMNGKYDFVNGDDGDVQLRLEAYMEGDSAVYDVKKTSDGCSIRLTPPDGFDDASEEWNEKETFLKHERGTDGICGSSKFSGVYSMKDTDDVKYEFRDDGTWSIEFSLDYSVDGDSFTLGKTKYKAETKKDSSGSIQSITLMEQDGTKDFVLKRQDDE